jgi:DNA-binding NtrC family response regulator
MVAEGRFRGDLFHRLSQLTLHVPPLRERIEDIGPLAWHMLEQHYPGASFTDRALRLLESHAWPGNVRELRNVVTRAAVMHAEGEFDPEIQLQIDSLHLPMGGSVPASRANPPAPRNVVNLEGMERRMIFDALAATGGHQQRAATQLGISRRTLSRKLKTYYEAEQGRVAV